MEEGVRIPYRYVVRMPYDRLSAEFYDLDKPIGRDYPDVYFVLDRLGGLPHHALVLEPAVGTGRAMIPILRAGRHVRGVDQSRSMIERCESNLLGAGLQAELKCGDFMDPVCVPPASCDAAILTFGTLSLFEPGPASDAALRALHRSLRPGGVLILDLYEPPEGARGERSTPDDGLVETRSVKRHDGSSIELLIRRTGSADGRSVILRLGYLLKSAGGEALAEEHEILVLWNLDRAMVRAALHKAGFDPVVEFENFGRGPVRSDEYTPVGLVATKS